MAGLADAFDISAALAVIGAIASALRGRHYVHDLEVDAVAAAAGSAARAGEPPQEPAHGDAAPAARPLGGRPLAERRRSEH